MKKLLLSTACLLMAFQGFGQPQFQLDLIRFEPTPVPVTNGGANNWFVNSTFPVSGLPSNTSPPNAYRDTVPAGPIGTNAYFYTNSYNCSSYGYVAFSFNHICKIPPAQRGTIEVSVNGAGGPWTPLTNAHYKTNFYRPNSSPFFP